MVGAALAIQRCGIDLAGEQERSGPSRPSIRRSPRVRWSRPGRPSYRRRQAGLSLAHSHRRQRRPPVRSASRSCESCLIWRDRVINRCRVRARHPEELADAESDKPGHQYIRPVAHRGPFGTKRRTVAGPLQSTSIMQLSRVRLSSFGASRPACVSPPSGRVF